MAQICADALGVDYRRVRVVHGQTDRIAFGIGAHASRVTVMTASATHIAALKVRAKALDVAAELLQAPPDALDIVDGEVVRKDRPGGPSISARRDRARIWRRPRRRCGDRDPGLSAEGWFRIDHQDYPYGVTSPWCASTARPAASTVERYLVAYDIGRAINPMLVEGQIVGGFAQGLGGALFEEFLYDERGEPLAVTFADYLMPTAREMPAGRRPDHRGRAEPAQSARHQGRRRRRHHRGRRRDRVGDRRRARHARRGDAAPGHAAAAEADPEQAARPRLTRCYRPLRASPELRQTPIWHFYPVNSCALHKFAAQLDLFGCIVTITTIKKK